MADHTPSDLPTRFTEKIKVDPASGCWLWTAFKMSNGYGRVGMKGMSPSVWLAHRAVYTLLVGPIPDGLTIDHICRVRHCVNPSHMRVVTQRENTMEPRSRSISRLNANKTRCIRGHVFEVRADGTRLCRECRTAHDRARSWADRAAAQSEYKRLKRIAARGGRPSRTIKISDADVALLRQLWVEGVKGVDLAAQFGIGKGQVSRIVNGKQRVPPQ